jgi:hypothetical protein
MSLGPFQTGQGLHSTSYTNGCVSKTIFEWVVSCVNLSYFHYCQQSSDNAVGPEKGQPMDKMISFT